MSPFKRFILPGIFLVLLLISCDKKEDDKDLVLDACILKTVILNNFPEVISPGEYWDPPDGYPDIYFEIKKAGEVVWQSIDKENAHHPLTYTFYDDITLSDPNLLHTLYIYDYDPVGDDLFMGGFDFIPADFEGLNTIVLSDTSEVEFSLEVWWSYEEQ